MKSNSRQVSSELLRLLTCNSITPLWDIVKLCVLMQRLKKNVYELGYSLTSRGQLGSSFLFQRSAKFVSYRGQPGFLDTGKRLKEYVSHHTEGNEVSSVCIYKDFLSFRRYTEFLYPVTV